MLELLRGRKTYLVAVITILVTGLYGAGYINQAKYEAITGVLVGLGLMTMRAAITKVAPVVLLALALGGCAGTNMTEAIKAMEASKVSACAYAHAIYGVGNGTGMYCRLGATKGNITVRPDGTITISNEGGE